MTESESPQLEGAELIRDFCTRLPGKPGVYRMYDAKGNVLYVGKARNLKNRVSNYARGVGHNNRIALMISLTAHMEFVTTASEAEALLLESNLIKKLKPRFNVILRDDKSFPYILIATDHPLDIGTHIDLLLELPNEGKPISAVGKVAWIGRAPGVSGEHAASVGVGIKFSKIAPGDLKAIVDYVNSVSRAVYVAP